MDSGLAPIGAPRNDAVRGCAHAWIHHKLSSSPRSARSTNASRRGRKPLLRAVVGLWLVPHALRNTFGFFPTTGVRANNLTALAEQLDRDGYRPGKLWAPAISITQLVAGPLLALGLFTRPAALRDPDLPAGHELSSAGASGNTSGISSASNTP